MNIENNKAYVAEFLPSLMEYVNSQSTHTLKKLCVEIQDLCTYIYSTLVSEDEKQIYYDTVLNIKSKNKGEK